MDGLVVYVIVLAGGTVKSVSKKHNVVTAATNSDTMGARGWLGLDRIVQIEPRYQAELRFSAFFCSFRDRIQHIANHVRRPHFGPIFLHCDAEHVW